MEQHEFFTRGEHGDFMCETCGNSEFGPIHGKPFPEQMEGIILDFLEHNKKALHPGRGKEDAKLVREACRRLGLQEEDYLPSFVVRDKARWGLTAERS